MRGWSRYFGGHALDLIEHVAGPIDRLLGHATTQHPDHTIAETGELIHVTAPDTLDVIGELAGECRQVVPADRPQPQ